MAEFKINHLEGTQYVDVHLNHEMVRVEAGALSYLQGDIELHSPLIPSIGGMFKSMIADEAVYRPTYSGTGIITLESSLGGFHALDLGGESWILERGTYWASEGSVDVSFHREKIIPSLWAGEGPVYLQTKVKGHGKVVVTTRGPIERIELEEGQKVVAEGKTVICRTGDVRFSVRRPTKNLMGRFTSGEGLVRVFEGRGSVILNPAPYWRYRIFMNRNSDFDMPSKSTT
ncbi:MAG: AIM24 family protein [Verrucomicrobiales bacterium]